MTINEIKNVEMTKTENHEIYCNFVKALKNKCHNEILDFFRERIMYLDVYGFWEVDEIDFQGWELNIDNEKNKDFVNANTHLLYLHSNYNLYWKGCYDFIDLYNHKEDRPCFSYDVETNRYGFKINSLEAKK